MEFGDVRMVWKQGMLVGVVMGIVFFGLWITLFSPSNSQSKVWQICDPSTSRCITPSLYLGKDVKEFCPNMNNFTKDVEYSWEGTGTNICPSAGHWECDKWENKTHYIDVSNMDSESFGDIVLSYYSQYPTAKIYCIRECNIIVVQEEGTCTHYIWTK